MIFRDNEFGSAEEDAWRRDFTVNAIFFDPVDRGRHHRFILNYLKLFPVFGMVCPLSRQCDRLSRREGRDVPEYCDQFGPSKNLQLGNGKTVF